MNRFYQAVLTRYRVNTESREVPSLLNNQCPFPLYRGCLEVKAFFRGFWARLRLGTLGKELKVGGEGFSNWPKMKLKTKLNGLYIREGMKC